MYNSRFFFATIYSICLQALVAELVDALDLGSSAFGVSVRVWPRAIKQGCRKLLPSSPNSVSTNLTYYETLGHDKISGGVAGDQVRRNSQQQHHYKAERNINRMIALNKGSINTQ